MQKSLMTWYRMRRVTFVAPSGLEAYADVVSVLSPESLQIGVRCHRHCIARTVLEPKGAEISPENVLEGAVHWVQRNVELSR